MFGIPDGEFGESLCAIIQLSIGATLSASDIRAALSATLARYKAPKVVNFLAELPREDSGKIFNRKLRDPYWENAGRKI